MISMYKGRIHGNAISEFVDGVDDSKELFFSDYVI